MRVRRRSGDAILTHPHYRAQPGEGELTLAETFASQPDVLWIGQMRLKKQDVLDLISHLQRWLANGSL